MPVGPGRRHPSEYQGDAVNGTAQDSAQPDLFAGSPERTMRSPPYLTNSSSVPPRPENGLVPGLIAAGIFIMFLLCLYAILWKCMVSPPTKRKRRKKRVVASPPSKKPVVL